MADDNSQLPSISNRQLQEMRFDEALEYLTPQLAPALPSHIPLERFKRVLLTAVNQSPDLARADRRSLFNACVRCAHDGLYPDGREAALVIFNTRVKRKVEENGRLVEREYRADLVQYLPMIAGIRKRMRNTGEVLSADAQVVHRHDKFYRSLGDDPKIIHEPPATLDQDRGDPIGAYAIIRLANGETIREVMGYHEIERVRAFSRAKDGPAWKNWWGEMARKTVLRRCSKAAPTGSDLERLLARDDDIPEASEHTPLHAIPPRPQPEDYADAGPQEDTPPITQVFTNDQGMGLASTVIGDPVPDEGPPEELDPEATNGIEIVGVDGEIETADDPEIAVDLLLAQINEAAHLGESRLKGLWESNQGAIEEIEKISREAAGPIYRAFRDALASFDRPKTGGSGIRSWDDVDHSSSDPEKSDREIYSASTARGFVDIRDAVQRTPPSDPGRGELREEGSADRSGDPLPTDTGGPPPQRTPQSTSDGAPAARRRGRPPATERRATQQETTNSHVKNPQAAPESPPAEQGSSPPPSLTVPLVQRGQGQTDWPATAERMIAMVKLCTSLDSVKPLPFGRFRIENRQSMELMRAADKEAWVSVEYALGQQMRLLQIQQGGALRR